MIEVGTPNERGTSLEILGVDGTNDNDVVIEILDVSRFNKFALYCNAGSVDFDGALDSGTPAIPPGPGAPPGDPQFANVKALLPLDDASGQSAIITDVSDSAQTITNDFNTDVSAETNFAGKTSLWQTSGNNYRIDSYNAAGISLVGNDWAWEAWYKPSSLDASNYGFFTTRAATNGFGLFRLSTGNIYAQAYNGPATPILDEDSGSGEVLTQDVWSYLAAEYHDVDNRWQVWVDGTRYINATATGDHTETANLSLFNYSTSRAKGYWQQMRLTQAQRFGVAATIPVPSVTFPQSLAGGAPAVPPNYAPSLAMEDKKSAAPGTRVLATTAGRWYTFEGNYHALRVQQAGGTPATGVVLLCGVGGMTR